MNGRTEDYVLVRHIPISRDSYTNWGIAANSFDNLPTWKYTTPHNILKKTPQTSGCTATCHATADKNQNLFLTTSFLQADYPDEITANSHIVMDGKWGVLK